MKELPLAVFMPSDTTSSCKFSRYAKPGRPRQSVLICVEHSMTRDLNFNSKEAVTAIRDQAWPFLVRWAGLEAEHKVDSRQ